MNLPLRPPRVATILCAAVAIEAVGNYYLPMYGAIATIAPTSRNPYAGAPYVSALRAMNQQGLRVMGEGGPLWPNWAGAMRFDDPQALNGMYPSRFIPFLNAFLKVDRDSRDLLDRFDSEGNPGLGSAAAQRWMTLSSIGYVVLPPSRHFADPHLRRVYDRDVQLYAYDRPLPRASVFHQAVRMPDDAALRALAGGRVDVASTLVLAESAPSPQAARTAIRSNDERAAITHRDAGAVTIDAHLTRAGYVMLNDTIAPGWTATIDGKVAPILQADYLFRAVALPAGDHRIDFAYHPWAAEVGLMLTLLGILLAAGMVLGPNAARRFRARVEVAVPVSR